MLFGSKTKKVDGLVADLFRVAVQTWDGVDEMELKGVAFEYPKPERKDELIKAFLVEQCFLLIAIGRAWLHVAYKRKRLTEEENERIKADFDAECRKLADDFYRSVSEGYKDVAPSTAESIRGMWYNRITMGLDRYEEAYCDDYPKSLRFEGLFERTSGEVVEYVIGLIPESTNVAKMSDYLSKRIIAVTLIVREELQRRHIV